jgi:hypothetical protein
LFVAQRIYKNYYNNSYLSSSWHDRFASKQFGNNAPCAPHIHTDTVLCGTEQKLRWSIPQGHNATRQWLRVAGVVGYRQPEIRNLQYPGAVDQEVRALDVSVKNPAFMAVVEAMKKLLNEALYLVVRGIYACTLVIISLLMYCTVLASIVDGTRVIHAKKKERKKPPGAQ